MLMIYLNQVLPLGLKGKIISLSAILILVMSLFSDASSPSENYLARYYFITVSAGPGGSIDPANGVVIREGGKQTFDITADKEYEIFDVLVDGESVGAVDKYEFTKVRKDHTIEAIFAIRTYTITPSAGTNGNITPSEPTLVKHGSDQKFSITPNPGYEIEDVQVDETSVGQVDSYIFENITADHSIAATFISKVGVLNVSIPNKSMKIDEVIPVTITVKDDLGVPFTFVSGEVGAYPLEGFQRISATTYGAEFTISQGGNSYAAAEDIPVSKLVISDGLDLSTPYNFPIIQDSDPLDAELPIITAMFVDGGIKKIGDVVTLVIEADGLNYSIDPLSTINGIAVSESSITFSESGSGSYMLSYTIQEGDTDLGPESSEFLVSVILIKPSGNIGLPFTTVTFASSLTIDANAPVLTRMEVPDLEVGVGDTLKVTVTADGTGYTAGEETMVNGVPLSSSRVTLTELPDGMYELAYVVDIEDAAVAPGQLQASITMIDEAGNMGSAYFTLEPNMLEIYTDLPQAVLIGTPEICEGEEAELTVFLTGKPPWSFDLSDGNTSTSFTNISSTEYKIMVSPLQSTTYQVLSLTDVNGVENTSAGSFELTVNETTGVEIINLAPGYNVEADPVKLEANIQGGTFSGPGVVSTSGYFYPYVADTIHSPHTIYYTFENTNGCTSIDSALVYVVGSQGDILIPGDKVCSNDAPFVASVFKNSGEIGSFSLLNSISEPVEGLTDNGDNTASIDPALLSPGDYTIEYQYFDEAVLYLRRSFSLSSIDQAQILNLDESPYCQNVAPFELQANLSNVVFEGPGVSGNMNDDFLFNPRETDPGLHVITCTTTSASGCTASSYDTIEVLFSPVVLFEVSTECLPEGGEIVSFHNLTSEPLLVEIWDWDFGDINSGEDNYSNLLEPTHHYLESGQKTISLSAKAYGACADTFELETLIDSRPEADFTWISNCFDNESGVKFVNLSKHGSSTVDTIIWTFKTSEGDVLGKIGSKAPTDTVVFQFDSADSYMVDLFTMNKGGCSDDLSKEILLRPSIRPDNHSYHEDFNETEGLWTIRSDNQVESWVWGEPDFTGYKGAAGDKAWFTQLPSATGGYEENSWIQSPCFDFTDFDRPLIKLDMMRSFYPYFSGAVLQYRDVRDEGWKMIGENRPGINWYNFDNIANKPGGSSLGWGSEEFNPDTEWVTAVHDLDQLAGKPNVELRIAFASIGKMSKGNQGLALNGLLVAERSKIAVMEHFTNYSDFTSSLADDLIDNLGSTHFGELINLQYHTSYPAFDPMNQNNPDPASTRGGALGVGQVPYTVLSGGLHRYDFLKLKESPLEDHLTLLSLEIPPFDIDLSVDWQIYGMEASTTVTCLADLFDENIHLYLVVFETSVNTYIGPNGDTQFRNVVLGMLPTPAGELLGSNWRKGDNDTRSNTWDYKLYVEDISELAVAAFIQDRNTGRILQAAVDYKDETVGIVYPSSERGSMEIYPNPTRGSIYVSLGDRTIYPGQLEISDINGRVVLSENLPPDSEKIQLNIEYLERGIYILQWIESGQTRGVSKIVKTR